MRPPDSWSRARLTLAITLVTAAVSLGLDAAGLNMWGAVWGGFIPARWSLGGDEGLAPFWLTNTDA